jgi:predicted DNA-binding transcriptional regulator AlpA
MIHNDSLPEIFAHERVLNVRQMAELWGVSVATLRRLHRRRLLPSAIQLSDRRIGWRAADALAALTARRERQGDAALITGLTGSSALPTSNAGIAR